MRKACLECVSKHVGNAVAVMDECHMGYPQYMPLVEGHLDQAASEALKEFPILAMELRAFRQQWSSAMAAYLAGVKDNKQYFPDVEALLMELHETRIRAIIDAQMLKDKEVGITEYTTEAKKP